MSGLKKLYLLLTDREKRSVVFLIFLMSIGMVLETLGIGLIIPAISLITQPEVLWSSLSLDSIITIPAKENKNAFVIVGLSFLVLIYLIKFLFLSFVTWRQNTIIFTIQAGLSSRLFTTYLFQPWVFHLQRNSSQLISNLTNEIAQITSSMISASLLFAEILVLFGIVSLLLYLEPVGALLVFTFLGFSAWVFNVITRKRLTKWGELRQINEKDRLKHLHQGLGAVKDIMLMGRERSFINRFEISNYGVADIAKKQNTLQQIPRLWLELLAVLGLSILVISILISGKTIGELTTTLGVFAAASFRLLPSVNRILNAIQSLRFNLSAIDVIGKEFEFGAIETDTGRTSVISLEEKIELENVTFMYPGEQQAVINDISLRIVKGHTLGIIGSSGSGKSTLVDLVMGLVSPSSGAIKVDGIDIRKKIQGWQSNIGFVPQDIYLTDDSLLKNIAFGIEEKEINKDHISRALHYSQLTEFVDSLDSGLETIVGERGVKLSGGQRQRIGIARALYHDPDVLILDEATSSLDSATESDVIDAVRSLHGTKTIIIIAHRYSTISHCDRIIELDNGKVARSGMANEMLERS